MGRYRTPRGVTLRPLKPDEVITDPVLECTACNAPTVHRADGLDPAVNSFYAARQWACGSCATTRRW